MAASTKIAVLGILNENDSLHGYEIKRLIEERMGDYTDVRFGSIYFALGEFLRKGDIAELDPGQVQADRSRRVYSITDKGRGTLVRLLHEELDSPFKHVDPVGVILNFSYLIAPSAIVAAFERRLGEITALSDHLETEYRRVMPQVEMRQLASLVFDHSREQLRVEREWTQKLLDALTERQGAPV